MSHSDEDWFCILEYEGEPIEGKTQRWCIPIVEIAPTPADAAKRAGELKLAHPYKRVCIQVVPRAGVEVFDW